MSWKKFVTFNSAPSVTTYPELPDQIIWFRLFLGKRYKQKCIGVQHETFQMYFDSFDHICLGLLYGISLGFRESAKEVKLKGGSGIIFGLNAILFLVSLGFH